MRKPIIQYILFFGILLAVFLTAMYYWAFTDEMREKKSTLAVINDSIPAFQFTDQNNQSFTKKKTDGKVYVAEYFFTTCKGICPIMNANMRRVYDAYKDEPDFLIASHTCQPEVDSVPLMKAYEQKMILGTLRQKTNGNYEVVDPATITAFSNKNWYFLNGPKSDLYQLARTGYMIDNGKPDSTQRIENQFIHSQFFSLVDRYGRVRGIYDGLIEDEVNKLIRDIAGLLEEKVEPQRFMNGFSNTPN
jgi:protein SCO1/2